MEKRSNSILNVLPAIFTVAWAATTLLLSPKGNTPRYTSEYIQINPNVLMCFTKYVKNKEDRRLCIIGESKMRAINNEGDTLPWYTYYSGPVPSELSSINNLDSLESIIHKTLDIKKVVMNSGKIRDDTTLKTRLKYKPIISKAIVDAVKLQKYNQFIKSESGGYH